MSRRPDPLEPDLRHSRLASWGPTPPSSARLARRLGAYYQKVRGGHLQPFHRSLADVESRPPTVPDSRLSGADLDELARIVPVRSDADARRAYSLGKSWPDLVAARSEALARACDAVVRPRSEDELERAVAWCADREASIVPVGGGTTVTGGIEPIGGTPDQAVVAVDVTGLAACLDVDRQSGVATFQAGVRGPDLEDALAPFGLTLGHVPQSFEYSTLGGWIATRSAGQQSLRYGKIEAMTASVRVVSPAGTLEVDHVPAHGAGPDLRELVLGSEGTVGVITQAAVRVRRRPDVIRFGAYLFGSFEDAQQAARALVQDPAGAGAMPTMVRVSDMAETAFNVGSNAPRALSGTIGHGMVRMLRAERAAMAFVLSSGTIEEARRTERRVDLHMGRHGGRTLGGMPARRWYHVRFSQPYARDVMMDMGLVVDTLETSVTWSRLPELHRQVSGALGEAFGGRCLAACHLSHLYHDGASAYFTLVAAPPAAGDGPEAVMEEWRAAKRAVHDAIVRTRGSASHQHGVGTMHADLYQRLVPALGLTALRAARASFDPAGLCNPGKLLEMPGGPAAVNAVGATGDASRRVEQDPA